MLDLTCEYFIQGQFDMFKFLVFISSKGSLTTSLKNLKKKIYE